MAKGKDKRRGGTAAHEDDVGIVHNLINQGYKLKLQFQLEQVTQQLEEHKKKKGKKKKEDEEFEEDPTIFLDLKLLESAARWTSYNKVMPTSVLTDDVSESLTELERIRKAQRGRVCSPSTAKQ